MIYDVAENLPEPDTEFIRTEFGDNHDPNVIKTEGAQEYFTYLLKTLESINNRIQTNLEKQRVLRESVQWERTYVSTDLSLPWFEDSSFSTPNFPDLEKKPVFHHLKKFTREEASNLRAGISGLWALTRLRKDNEAEPKILKPSISFVKLESEIPWEDVSHILPNRTTTEVKLKWLNQLDPRLKSPHEWSEDEVELLEKAARRHGKICWCEISNEVDKIGRTPLQCFIKWQEMHRKDFLKVEWSQEEDERMRELVYKHGEKEWKLIASEMPKRSPEQLLHRWTRTSNPNITHGRWAQKDDFKLIIMMRYLTGDLPIDKKDKTQVWSFAASIFPHKTDRKVRERWCNVIDCEKKEFTPSIDARIIKLVKEKYKGVCRGSEIAKLLKTGHTGAQINRRYKKLNKTRKQKKRAAPASTSKQSFTKSVRIKLTRDNTTDAPKKDKKSKPKPKRSQASRDDFIADEFDDETASDSGDEYFPPGHELRRRKRKRSAIEVKTERVEEPPLKRQYSTRKSSGLLNGAPPIQQKVLSNRSYPGSWRDAKSPQSNFVQAQAITPYPKVQPQINNGIPPLIKSPPLAVAYPRVKKPELYTNVVQPLTIARVPIQKGLPPQIIY